MSESTPDQIVSTAIAQVTAGNLVEAQRLLREVLNDHPDHLIALNQLRLIAEHTGQREQALQLLQRLLELEPRNAGLRHELAHTLEQRGQLDEAEREYLTVLAQVPDAWSIYNNLAVVHRRQRRYAAALEMIVKAIQLSPDAAPVHLNHAQILSDLGDVNAAIIACERSLQLRPGHLPTLVSKSRALFLAGRLPEAFELYDVRFQAGGISYPKFNRPMWSGEDPAGKRIVVVVEQGAGDTIQFARYLPQLRARGAEVILLCENRLESLLIESFPGIWVVSQYATDQAFDFHIPIVTLAHRFGTTLQTIPADVPYLTTDAERRRQWSERLADKAGMKVGLVWAGSAGHTNDKYRSLTLEHFAPLINIEGVSFFSLQKGPPPATLAAQTAAMGITDLSPDLHDYSDTAAALDALDLLITVDTSCAHLAGALARPVWTLLAFEPDWRWMLQRADTPWYPTMKLFRQPTPGDWSAVVDEAAQHLRDFIKAAE